MTSPTPHETSKIMNKAIRTPVGPPGLGRTVIGEEEIRAVTDLLREPEKLFRYRGSEPTQSSLLEKELEAKLGVKHALFVNSGTSALTCCLVGWGIGPGDEVIVPAYTYIASTAAVLICGGVPVIAEIDESLTLDPARIEDCITSRTLTPISPRRLQLSMPGLCRSSPRLMNLWA